ncbi:hypothetical protein DFH94DRAFT_678141 [Russula ochroleuca]|uniref:Uncharacterized protein n=1 Tax=Russula ochroleuca TaxID=152965 RepID=A0A9P5TE64_9AGAM|nr:hypothetical protein DFH94DRAFT_678141 [Russula ochroleuca]
MLARIVEWEMIFAGPFSQRSQRKGLEHVEYSLTPAYDASCRKAASSPSGASMMYKKLENLGYDVPSSFKREFSDLATARGRAQWFAASTHSRAEGTQTVYPSKTCPGTRTKGGNVWQSNDSWRWHSCSDCYYNYTPMVTWHYHGPQANVTPTVGKAEGMRASIGSRDEGTTMLGTVVSWILEVQVYDFRASCAAASVSVKQESRIDSLAARPRLNLRVRRQLVLRKAIPHFNLGAIRGVHLGSASIEQNVRSGNLLVGTIRELPGSAPDEEENHGGPRFDLQCHAQVYGPVVSRCEVVTAVDLGGRKQAEGGLSCGTSMPQHTASLRLAPVVGRHGQERNEI